MEGMALAAHPAQVPSSHRCGLLNCEAVLELLTRCLAGTSELVQMVRAAGAWAAMVAFCPGPPWEMGGREGAQGSSGVPRGHWGLRPSGVEPADPVPIGPQRALGAITSLGRTDLLPQEHILLLARPHLQKLSAGCPGPVTNKAAKVGSSWGPEEWAQGHPIPPVFSRQAPLTSALT